ncbi:MAG: hybrid sensor histidine kinase/response regulator transcription factor [Rhodothermales bacterium]
MPVQAHKGAGLDTTWALLQYVHDAWQVQEGLPQNTVKAIAQTPDGYLWLGTDEGLARYNGTAFTTYDRTTTPELTDPRIAALRVAPDGGLWVGTMAGGLLHFDGETWTPISAPDSTVAPAVETLADAHGQLWVASGADGMFSLADNRLIAHPQNSFFAERPVLNMSEAPDGALWVGTRAGLFHVTDHTAMPVDGLPDGSIITALFNEPGGPLWVSTAEQIYHVRSESGTFEATPFTFPGDVPTVAARRFYQDAQGSLWIGTSQQGLLRWADGHVQDLDQSQGLTHNRVLALLEDREGSLWIGTEGGGINRIRQGKARTFGTREGLPMGMVLTVAEAPDGSVWAGLEGGGVSRIHNGSITTYTSADGLAADLVTSVSATPDGAVWIGTYGGGLQAWRNGQLAIPLTEADGLPSPNVMAHHVAADGSLWLGTNAGIAHYENGTLTPYTPDDGLSSPFVTAITTTPDGAVWIANYDGGLDRLHDGTVTTFTPDDGLPGAPIISFLANADGTLWMSTYGAGLLHYDGAAFQALSTVEGLPSDIVYSILPDASERLWMSSNKGLFHIDRAEAQGVLHGTTERVTATIYDEADGLRSREFNGGLQPAAWRATDGTLWFASGEGVVGIHPERMPRNLTPPLVAIEAIDVDHEPVARTDDEVRLAPGRKRFAFTLAGLSFIAPERTTFRYKLDGYDDAWETVTGAQTITYTALPPGPYSLRVHAVNADGVSSTEAAVFGFYHRAFFWQQPWFWFAVGLALVALAGLIVRWRIQLLKARQAELERLVDLRTAELREEKERVEEAKEVIEAQAEKLVELDRFKTAFFANISHEFRTPLTLMIGPLQNALSGAFGEVSGPVRSQLAVMLRNAMRMLRLINQLLDLSKLESNRMEIKVRPRNLVAFTESVVYSFTAYAEQKRIALTMDADADTHEVYYEPDKLEKVLYNLLSNAMKFTPEGGEIGVHVAALPATDEAPDGWVEVRVQDSGRGIPEADLPYVFDRFRQVDGSNTREQEGTGIGLALVRELVLLHHGTIHVESTWGEGTTFIVRLRQGHAHFDTANIQAEGADELADAPSLLEQGSGHVDQIYKVHEINRPAQIAEAPDHAPLLLVVDDNDDIRQYITDCLGGLYRIEEARDGAEGFTQAQQHRPDLIITDLMMPNVDGHAFTANIRADETLQHTPVIILSAKTSQETVIRGLEHGADEYLAKPFNARELKIRIANLLKLRMQERELAALNEQLEEKVEAQVQTILHQRERYEAELIAEKEKAEEASRVKSSILNNMSHEFRTPLAAIISSAEILEMEVEGELQEFAGFARTNGERLLKTLAAVLELAELEGSGSAWQAKNINLIPAVQQVYQMYEAAATDKGLDLNVSIEKPHILGYFDAKALERLLSVLVDNAIKFTETGEVVIEAGYEAQAPFVRVRDTGMGISEAFMPKLFEAFQQESAGDTRAFEGTGLSLSIAKRLADRADARLAVDSTPGEGSTFTLYLADQAQTAPAKKAA